MEIDKHKYVDLHSLGVEYGQAKAEWYCSTMLKVDGEIIGEKIPKGKIGQIYYDILFYAFIY